MRASAEILKAEEAAVGKGAPSPSLPATGAVFFLADTAALILAPLLGQAAWRLANPSAPAVIGLWPALLFFWALFWLTGLYPGVGMTPVEQLRRIVRATALIYLILLTSVFLMKQSEAYSRGALTLAGLFSVALVPYARALVCRLYSSKPWWGAPIVILGAGKTARLLIAELQEKRAIGFTPVACLDDDPAKAGECGGVPVIGPLSLAAEVSRAWRIRYAVLAMPGLPRKNLLHLLEQCSAVFPHVILIPDLFGISTLWVSARDLSGILGLELQYNLLIPLNRWIKRAMDVALSAALLVCAAPAMALCALAILVVNPGPILYFQDREGFGQRRIRIPKLRTMYLNAEALLTHHLLSSPAAAAEWESRCKLRHDPRVLPWIGKFLRRTSLDELPQLWNVLKGEMSLVGPRPLPGYHAARFKDEFRALRRKVMPGLTGLWQINGRSNGDLGAQEQLDRYYIANWSVWLDIYILCRTARAVIEGDGAY